MTRSPDQDVPESPGPSASAGCPGLPDRTSPTAPPGPQAWDDDPYGEDERGDQAMPLLEHLGELRARLLRCLIALVIGFLACYAFAESLYDEILRPLEAALPSTAEIVFGRLQGAFLLHLQVALLAGLIVTTPYIFYQIWAFIAPGLYAHERRYILPLAVLSALFFACGAAFCYLVVFPFAFDFFLQYSTERVRAMLEVESYFSLVLKLIFAFGLIFEMPLFAFFLARLGLVTASMLRRVRKYAVLGIFILAAVLTPPDVFSQLLMAAPMLILYELSILVAVIFGRKDPKPDPQPAEPGPDPTPEDAL